jgi:hypothetical protein
MAAESALESRALSEAILTKTCDMKTMKGETNEHQSQHDLRGGDSGFDKSRKRRAVVNDTVWQVVTTDPHTKGPTNDVLPK